MIQLFYLVCTDREAKIHSVVLSQEKHKPQPRAGSRHEAKLVQEQISCHKERPRRHDGVPVLARIHVPVGGPGRHRHVVGTLGLDAFCNQGSCVIGSCVVRSRYTDLTLCAYIACVPSGLLPHESDYYFIKWNFIMIYRSPSSIRNWSVCSCTHSTDIPHSNQQIFLLKLCAN